RPPTGDSGSRSPRRHGTARAGCRCRVCRRLRVPDIRRSGWRCGSVDTRRKARRGRTNEFLSARMLALGAMAEVPVSLRSAISWILTAGLAGSALLFANLAGFSLQLGPRSITVLLGL